MTFVELIQSQLQNQFFSGAVLGGGLLGAVAMLRSIPGKIWNRVVAYFTVSLTVHSSLFIYDSFLKWFGGLWLTKVLTNMYLRLLWGPSFQLARNV